VWNFSSLSDFAVYCVGRDQVLGIGMAILGAEAPAMRKDLHKGRHPMDVARQLVTDETVKEAAVFKRLHSCSYHAVHCFQFESWKQFYPCIRYFKFPLTHVTVNSVPK